MIINMKMIKINRISDEPYGASAILFNIEYFRLVKENSIALDFN